MLYCIEWLKLPLAALPVVTGLFACLIRERAIYLVLAGPNLLGRPSSPELVGLLYHAPGALGRCMGTATRPVGQLTTGRMEPVRSR